MKRTIIAATIILIGLNLGEIHAQDCNRMQNDMREASDAIDAVKRSSALTEARDRARHASNILEAAGMLAKFCGCSPAAGALFEASEIARRAAGANSSNPFKDDFNRSIRSFNDGVYALNRCNKN